MRKKYIPIMYRTNLSVWKWLDKFAWNLDRKEGIKMLITVYGLTHQEAEGIYNKWRREYIEI